MNHLSKINLSELEDRFDAFQNMNLETTWVDFKTMTLVNPHVEVLTPVLHPKPFWITRVVYWLLSFVGIVIYDYGKTAQKLTQSITHFKSLTPNSNHEAITDFSKKILTKLAKNHFSNVTNEPIFDWQQMQLQPFTDLALDWNKDDILFPINGEDKNLYDESFVQKILSQNLEHPILGPITCVYTKRRFLSFLNLIMGNSNDLHSQAPRLSYPENKKRFRHMTLAILNLIDPSLDNSDTMTKLAEATRISSNNFNGKNIQLEDLFYDIFSRSCSDLRFNVFYFLQIMRRDILKDAIDDLMKKVSPNYNRFLRQTSDQTSEFTYYFRTMHNEFSFSDSSTQKETNHERNVCKNKERELRAYFYHYYTPKIISNQILEIINNRDDSRISTELFEKWVLDNYAEKSDQWIDENGKYRMDAVIAMLKSFGIIS